jgi:hypothetical protein
MAKSKWVFIATSGMFGLIGLIAIGVRYSPMFTILLLGIIAAAVVFMASEEGLSHGAIEYENRFWSFMAFVLACSLLLCPDSPLVMDDLTVALTMIAVFTYIAHLSDRYMRTAVMNRIPNLMRRIRSADFGCLEERSAAHDKVVAVEKLVNKIDNSFISSTFMNVFAIPFVLKCEREIINVFSEVNPRELNFMVQTISLARVMYKIKDHKLMKIMNRTKLLELLAVKRIKDLTPVSKAYLLHGFQGMKLSAHPQSAYFVKCIIQSTTLDDLSDVKCLTDSKSDINSMHKLIYQDIKDKKIQAEILEYIKTQANTQLAHMLIGSRRGKNYEKRPWRKILSDIDDTMTCSGGSWPAGIHTAYPKHTLYPGVLAFYRELDLGITGHEEWNDTLLGNLVFLSARPHVYKAISEDESYKKFRFLKTSKNLYTSPTLLAGSLDSGTKFVFGGDIEPVAEKKFIKFVEYIGLYPEFKYIFVGDNGQGDARTVEMLMDKPGYSDYLARAYIHEVQPVRSTYAKKASTRSSYCSHIYYFRNYIDAAIDAYQRKLIRLSGLRRIMIEAVHDFQSIDWSGSHPPAPSQQGLRAAVAQGKSALPSQSGPAHSSTKSPVHSGQSSSKSTIVSAGSSGHKSSASTPARLMLAAQEMEIKRDIQMRELNLYLRKGNKILSGAGIGPVALLEFFPRHGPGDVVSTPYGRGIVKRFRPLDGMYELLLYWDNSGFGNPITASLRSPVVQPCRAPADMPLRSSLFRPRSLPALAVTNLEVHLKSIAFASTAALKKMELAAARLRTAAKSAVVPVAAVREFDLSALLNSTVREQAAGLRQYMLNMDTSISRLATMIPKPADWDAYRSQLQILVTCSSSTQVRKTVGMFVNTNLAAPVVPPKANPSSGNSGTVTPVNVVTKSTESPPAPPSIADPLICRSDSQIANIAGSLVWTTMGIGWIAGFRDSDGMILVIIDISSSSKTFHWQVPSPLDTCNALLESNLPDNSGTSRPHYATCYMNRASLVLLTDQAYTIPYQQVLARHYLHSKLAAAAMKLEVAREQRELRDMQECDEKFQFTEFRSPSRLTAAFGVAFRIFNRSDIARPTPFPIPAAAVAVATDSNAAAELAAPPRSIDVDVQVDSAEPIAVELNVAPAEVVAPITDPELQTVVLDVPCEPNNGAGELGDLATSAPTGESAKVQHSDQFSS